MHISSREGPNSAKLILLVLFTSIISCQEVINGTAYCHTASVIFGNANLER